VHFTFFTLNWGYVSGDLKAERCSSLFTVNIKNAWSHVVLHVFMTWHSTHILA